MCTQGRCLLTLADNQTLPDGIGVDSTNVYWTASGSNLKPTGTLMKVPIGGGSPVTLATDQYLPLDLVLDDTYVYWANGGSAPWRVSKVGGDAAALPAPPYVTGPLALAVDSTFLYMDGALKMPKAGGTPTQMSTGGGTSVVIDQTNLYFADSYSGLIASVPLAGTSIQTPNTIASQRNSPYGIAIDSTTVYWTEYTGSNSIMKCALGGGVPPVVVAANQFHPAPIVVDGTWIYFGTGGASGSPVPMIFKVSITGGAVIPLVSDVFGAASMAVDATSLYWTTSFGDAGNGRVMKLTPK